MKKPNRLARIFCYFDIIVSAIMLSLSNIHIFIDALFYGYANVVLLNAFNV